VTFSAKINCVMFVMWVAVVGRRNRETNMTMNHSKMLLKPTLFTKLLNIFFLAHSIGGRDE
jgi:hypothetical protein